MGIYSYNYILYNTYRKQKKNSLHKNLYKVLGFFIMSKLSKSELMFYKSYHQHPINKIIHVICIPLIAISMGNLFALLPINMMNGWIQGDSLLMSVFLFIYWTQWPRKIAKI